MMKHHMTIAGVERDLPLCKVDDTLSIGAFVIFGDVELTVACARELLKLAPEYDYMITAESKGIPLVYEMARQSGQNKYLLARKSAKLYMRDVFSVEVRSITTDHVQRLYLDGEDAALIKGKRILIVDDVISTGRVSPRGGGARASGGRRGRGAHGDPRGRRRAGPQGYPFPGAAAAL